VPVDEPDVVIVPMMAYDLVLGLPWSQSRNSEIDWSKGQLLGLRTPVGNSGNEQTITSLPQGDGSAEDGACEPPPAVYIQFLGATAFDSLMRSSQPSPYDLTRHRSAGSINNVGRRNLMKTRLDEPRSMLNGQAGSSGGSCSRRGSAGKP